MEVPFQSREFSMNIQFSIQWSGLLIMLMVIALFLSVSPAAATIFSEDGSELTASNLYELTNTTPPEEKEPVVFLYDPDCGSCAPAHEYLTGYLQEHPDIEVEMLSLSEGTKGKETYDERKAAFHREKVYIPVMYIGPVALEGPSDIQTHFEDVYRWYTQI